VQVRLADDNRPGAPQLRDDRRIVLRPARRHGRSRRRRCPGDVDKILHRNRDAVQGPTVVFSRNLLFGARGVGERLDGHHRDEGPERVVVR